MIFCNCNNQTYNLTHCYIILPPSRKESESHFWGQISVDVKLCIWDWSNHRILECSLGVQNIFARRLDLDVVVFFLWVRNIEVAMDIDAQVATPKAALVHIYLYGFGSRRRYLASRYTSHRYSGWSCSLLPSQWPSPSHAADPSRAAAHLAVTDLAPSATSHAHEQGRGSGWGRRCPRMGKERRTGKETESLDLAVCAFLGFSGFLACGFFLDAGEWQESPMDG